MENIDFCNEEYSQNKIIQELLPLKEVRGKSKVYLSDIINAIRCNDPQKSAYADMMKVLLTVRTDIGDEEDGDEGGIFYFLIILS